MTESTQLIQGVAKSFAACLLKRIYGVRGSLKPPLGGPSAGLLYPVRYRVWNFSNRLYDWSGIPAQWRARMVEKAKQQGEPTP